MYYYSRYSDPSTALIVFAVISLILTILAVIFITPRRRKPELNGFFLWLHRVFNFDELLIDKILKFLYIFSTLYVFFGSIVMLCCGYEALPCLLVMLLGPFAVRLVYEAMIMFIILVRNVSEINRKIGGTPAPEPAPVRVRPEVRLCPNCGKKLNPGSSFCGNCGSSVPPTSGSTPY